MPNIFFNPLWFFLKDRYLEKKLFNKKLKKKGKNLKNFFFLGEIYKKKQKQQIVFLKFIKSLINFYKRFGILISFSSTNMYKMVILFFNLRKHFLKRNILKNKLLLFNLFIEWIFRKNLLNIKIINDNLIKVKNNKNLINYIICKNLFNYFYSMEVKKIIRLRRNSKKLKRKKIKKNKNFLVENFINFKKSTKTRDSVQRIIFRKNGAIRPIIASKKKVRSLYIQYRNMRNLMRMKKR